MSGSEFSLLTKRRFLPLFLTQFLGALNDNLYKNALVVLVVYRLAGEGADGGLLVTAAAGLFILPFFLFSATAGQIADKFDKALLIRVVKVMEIVVMLGGAWALSNGSVVFLLAVLFLMGLQSALFGPLKYAILPTHLGEDELIGGNALISGATFLAILLGTITGGLLILGEGGVALTSVLVVVIAVLGTVTAWYIPAAPSDAPDLRINLNPISEIGRVLKRADETPKLRLDLLGISWFWLVGATFLAEFPVYVKEYLGANEQVVTLFLTVFSLGIGLGALTVNKLLDGKISAKYVPLGALGMTLFILDFYAASPGAKVAADVALIDAAAFLGRVESWRILIDLLGLAMTAGLYIVPLYALMQKRAPVEARARIVAANNILNAAFMVAGSLGAMAVLAAGFSVPAVFLLLAVLNAVVTVAVIGLVPDALLKSLIRLILRGLFRVEARGLEHFEAAGEKAVVVVNHVSFLDGVLLGAFLPFRPLFAVNTFIAQAWWVRPFLGLVDAYTIDPTHPLGMRGLLKAVRDEGRTCVIFPEGRITVTGALMKIYEGPALIAQQSAAPIIPVRIDGAQYSLFSRLKGKVRRRLLPKITLTVLPPCRLTPVEGVTARERRRLAGVHLHDVMAEANFVTSLDPRRTLFEALIDARDIFGAALPIVEDIERRPLNLGKLIVASLALGRRLAGLAEKGEVVGVLLPNSIGAAVTFFALQAWGRVPAMLNFSMGAGGMAATLRVGAVKTVLTSRRFVEAARLEAAVAALAETARIVYLEDVKAAIGPLERLRALALAPCARRLHAKHGGTGGDTAVVLFTSGSEGVPKGVALSHANLLANKAQVAARIDFNPTDIVFNALPIFHSFGLTGGMLLPMLSGVRTFLYPSPLHYRIVPALSYDTDATILFGTDAFLNGYGRTAHPYDFYSVRYVFAGAEKVRDETRALWADKFGLRLLEGYGATETAPVLAVNTPMHFKAGTVGRLLPGIDIRIEPVPGIDGGGRLHVRGPNVMRGYLHADEPGVIVPPPDGWYDTGDIVEIDGEGFVRIKGRAKRFAKIAGEMISLSAVEAHAATLWPDARHAVIGLPDPKKGERLTLVTEQEGATREAFFAYAKTKGLSELMTPKDVRVIAKLPLLGSGKVDIPAVERLIASSGDD